MLDREFKQRIEAMRKRNNTDSKLTESDAKALKSEMQNHLERLDALKSEIEVLINKYEPDIENLVDLIAESTELKETLTAKKEELHHYYTTACKPLVEAKREAKEAQKEVNQELQAIFESIVDESDVVDALHTMTQMTGQVKTRCRREWEEAQGMLIDAYNALKDAGWYSKALDEITELNWNKQRNFGETTARDFDYDDFYAITKVE